MHVSYVHGKIAFVQSSSSLLFALEGQSSSGATLFADLQETKLHGSASSGAHFLFLGLRVLSLLEFELLLNKGIRQETGRREGSNSSALLDNEEELVFRFREETGDIKARLGASSKKDGILQIRLSIFGSLFCFQTSAISLLLVVRSITNGDGCMEQSCDKIIMMM